MSRPCPPASFVGILSLPDQSPTKQPSSFLSRKFAELEATFTTTSRRPPLHPQREVCALIRRVPENSIVLSTTRSSFLSTTRQLISKDTGWRHGQTHSVSRPWSAICSCFVLLKTTGCVRAYCMPSDPVCGIPLGCSQARLTSRLFRFACSILVRRPHPVRPGFQLQPERWATVCSAIVNRGGSEFEDVH